MVRTLDGFHGRPDLVGTPRAARQATMPRSESPAWNRVNICRTTAASCSTSSTRSPPTSRVYRSAKVTSGAGRAVSPSRSRSRRISMIRAVDRPTICSRRKTRRSCSSTTSPRSWPGSVRWTGRSWSRTPSRRSGRSRPSGSRSCTRPSTWPPAGVSRPSPNSPAWSTTTSRSAGPARTAGHLADRAAPAGRPAGATGPDGRLRRAAATSSRCPRAPR